MPKVPRRNEIVETVLVALLTDHAAYVQIPFVFANPVQNITALGSDPARLELGQMAARMWTSFVADLNPNGHGGEFVLYSEVLCLMPLY